jgi:hypothetical protein
LTEEDAIQINRAGDSALESPAVLARCKRVPPSG